MVRTVAFSLLVDAVDRPAHAALTLGHRGLLPTAAQALAGLFAVALATAGTQLLLGGGLGGPVDGLMAFAEVSLLLIPAALMAAFLQDRVPLRTLLGTVAVGLLHAGVVALCLLPLVVFVAVVADLESVYLVSPLAHGVLVGLMVPGLALLTLLERITDIVRSVVGSPWAVRSARALSFAMAAAFLVRAWQLI